MREVRFSKDGRSSDNPFYYSTTVYPTTVYPTTVYPTTVYPTTVYPTTVYPTTVFRQKERQHGTRLL